jgi:flagellin-like protein
MKGISPLIASALLIAITIGIAVILANYVSSYTERTLSLLPTCIGGNLIYVTADYPKWGTNKIIAAVEAQNVPMGDFSFDILLNNDTVLTSADAQGLSLAAGATGTVISQTLGVVKTDIKQVRISTNCSNVKTGWATLR